MLRFTPFVISCFAILSLCSQTKADLVLNVDTAADLISVSYTHLTLPTIYSV